MADLLVVGIVFYIFINITAIAPIDVKRPRCTYLETERFSGRRRRHRKWKFNRFLNQCFNRPGCCVLVGRRRCGILARAIVCFNTKPRVCTINHPQHIPHICRRRWIGQIGIIWNIQIPFCAYRIMHIFNVHNRRYTGRRRNNWHCEYSQYA